MKTKKTYRKHELKFMSIFSGIKSRCNSSNNVQYKNYGLKGIKCDWISFEDFYRDMLPGYKLGLSIDRIDNNGNYCKENCRWLTKSENSRKADKSYIPESNLYEFKKRPFNPLDVLFDNSGLNIKGYCGESKVFKDDVNILGGIEIHTYYQYTENSLCK